MKKRLAIFLSLAIIAVIVVSTFVAIQSYKISSGQVASKKPFYVGVTYCGDSTTEADQLIERVKNYTNLFVLQSGSLMQNLNATEQICDYAVNSGLNVILYYGVGFPTNTAVSLLNIAQTRWGSHFLGLYLNDEPGGKMLDAQVTLYSSGMNATVIKEGDGSVSITESNASNDSIQSNPAYTQMNFAPSGTITIYSTKNLDTSSNTTLWNSNSTLITFSIQSSTTVYYPNGTIVYVSTKGGPIRALIYQPDGTVHDQNGTVVTDQGNISQFEPYQTIWDSRPIQTYAEAANLFVSTEQYNMGSIRNQSKVKLFTSDYALDWFDYQGGYDVVLGQLGWNQSTKQNIALVRGAADMQNKSWGAIITWQSQSAPYLQSGNQMYGEMRQAYECGAQYVVVFNYSPNGNGTGLLQEEHFAALQKFWSDVVQNPKETNNVKALDALVLPQNYGWGMRNPNDIIWGLWQPDNSSQQVWTALQTSLVKYGSKLDIVYDSSAYPVAGRYQHIYYWNQTT